MNNPRQRGLNRIAACCALCLITTVYSISERRVAELHRQQAQVYGCCTVEQIVNRSDAVCRTLNPQANGIEFTAEELTIPAGIHRSRWEWSVECRHTADKDLADMTWNAETGQLILISGTEQMQQHLTPITPDREVIGLFRTWLRLFGMIAAGERWDVMGRPRLANTTWQLKVRRGDEVIHVKLCIRLGQLTISRRHLPVSSRVVYTSFRKID